MTLPSVLWQVVDRLNGLLFIAIPKFQFTW